MPIATRHHHNHPPPPPPQLQHRRYSPVGIGLVVVLTGAALGWLGGQLDPAEPCITVSAWARQDKTNGFWYEAGIPVGWSQPGTDTCIQEVPE